MFAIVHLSLNHIPAMRRYHYSPHTPMPEVIIEIMNWPRIMREYKKASGRINFHHLLPRAKLIATEEDLNL